MPFDTDEERTLEFHAFLAEKLGIEKHRLFVNVRKVEEGISQATILIDGADPTGVYLEKLQDTLRLMDAKVVGQS